MNRSAVALFAGVALLAALVAGTGILPGDWEGADDELKDEIERENPEFEPWIEPFWEPPSSEVESLLFGLQVAIGALIVGYVAGSWRPDDGGNQ